MNMRFSVTVLGSLNTDLSIFTERFPQPGETLMGSKFVMGCGGKGANQSVAAKFLGSDVALIGKLGTDTFGDCFVESFREIDINTAGLTRTNDSSTGVAVITVETGRGENRIVVALGANMLLSIDDVNTAVDNQLLDTRVLVCQFETNASAVLHGLKLARQKEVVTILNPAPAPNPMDPQKLGHADLLHSMLPLCDFFCPNETEAIAILPTSLTITESGDVTTLPVDAFIPGLRWLAQKGVKHPIVTLGCRGLVVLCLKSCIPTETLVDVNVLEAADADRYDNQVVLHLMAPEISDVIDTTGAGDCFVGALAHFIANLETVGLVEQLRRALWVASQSVRRIGTQLSFPKREQLPNNLFQSAIFHWPEK